MRNARTFAIIGGAFIGLIFLISVFSSTFVTIQSGERGLLFKKFAGGLVMDHIYDQGFHVVAPWNTMFKYNTRLQEQQETMDVLANNGLSLSVELSVRFRPIPDSIGYLHNEIGPEYAANIVIPEIRSATREVLGKYSPEELYKQKRDQIQQEVFDRTKKSLSNKYIQLDVVLFRSVTLPDAIQEAIQRKLKQEQEAEEYSFRIEKEKKEAERKNIEAEGIKAYQNIVAQSLSDKLLEWQGIEATKELANSTNAKVVIIGSSKNGLPLILGNQ